METFYFSGYVCHYLYYYFRHPTDDYLSHQILDFKQGKELQAKVFSEIAAAYFEEENLEFDYIVRALGSRETVALKSSPLKTLCESIAQATNARYLPTFLKKNHETEPLKKLNLQQRREVLEKAYAINVERDFNDKDILIIDDISTTGSSLKAIAKCIKENYKTARIQGFCLAKTKSLDYDQVSENKQESVDIYKEFLKSHK